MQIKDERYHGKQTECEVVFTFQLEEMETTVNRNNKEVMFYSSLKKDITRILKVCDHDKVQVLSVSAEGKITSLKVILEQNQLSFRNK